MAMADPVYAVFVDGPFAGTTTRVTATRAGWPLNICRKAPGGRFEHHDHDGDGRYRHVGGCAAWGHEITDWCDHTWDDDDGRHRCTEINDHDTHRCCCGTEAPNA